MTVEFRIGLATDGFRGGAGGTTIINRAVISELDALLAAEYDAELEPVAEAELAEPLEAVLEEAPTVEID